MPSALTPASFAQALGRAARVYWPGCAGHSPLFERWLRESPQLAAGRWFSGMWIPGVNRFDPTSLHPDAKASSFFVSRDFRAGWQRGAVQHLPLHYRDASRWLSQPGRFDLVLLQLSPPDDQGACSLSVACDFTPDILQQLSPSATVLAHVNPRMPRTRGPSVQVQRIHAWVEADAPPLTVTPDAPDSAADDALDGVAAQVSRLVDDGDTVQLGLGQLQGAVLRKLHQHRQLRLHAGMVSEGLLPLIDSGALADPSERGPPVCTGVALGSEALYQRLTDPDLARFEPVSYTHDALTLARLPRLKAINSALEIDLLGQVNCEWLDGRLVSGVGGLVDFLRGASASAGGRAVVAATARAGRQGQLSRIVPLLAAGATSIARSDVDTVVTEYGHAALRERHADARAKALIGIAAPEHREALERAWHALRQTV